LNNKNLTEQQKSDINKKYSEKERQAKRKQAEDNKKLMLNQAIMNGLLAISSILAQYPKFDGGFAMGAALVTAGITSAINVAKIASTPIPQFAKGTKNAPKGYALVGEEGPEIVKLAGGEKIYTYSQSKKIGEAWGAGSVASADNIISNYSYIPTATSQDIQVSKANTNSTFIDYGKLGKTIAQNVSSGNMPSLIMDEYGYNVYLTNEIARTKITNKRRTL
jgi:phage-related tail protein